MKWLGVIAAIGGLTLAGCARPRPVRDIAELERTPIHQFSDPELDTYLRALASRGLTLQARVELIARRSIGQPYRLYVLGEYPFELYDADPMVCLSASDCVTFVEQTWAMALADDWPGFFKILQRIRYRGGIVGIRARNHFTEADWNPANAWLFEDMTAKWPDVPTEGMRQTVDRRAFFARFGVEYTGPVQVYEDRYIPKQFFEQAAPQLCSADIIEIVRGAGDAAWVGHMGLAFRSPAGRVMMIHSGRPAVQEVDLEEYLRRHAAVRGFKVLRARGSAVGEAGTELPARDSESSK